MVAMVAISQEATLNLVNREAGGRLALPKCCPKCGKAHRTWYALANCRWPKAEWIAGNGPWASLSLCPRGLTVELHDNRDEALTAKRVIDQTRCGGACLGAGYHVVVCLVRLPAGV